MITRVVIECVCGRWFSLQQGPDPGRDHCPGCGARPFDGDGRLWFWRGTYSEPEPRIVEGYSVPGRLRPGDALINERWHCPGPGCGILRPVYRAGDERAIRPGSYCCAVCHLVLGGPEARGPDVE